MGYFHKGKKLKFYIIMAKQNKQEAERNEELAAKVSSSEKFYNEHKGLIWGVLGGIVVIGLAILGYSRFIYTPAVAEAQQAVFPAELNFQNGEWELALEGDGNVAGFAEVIDQYGAKAGKAVYLYAGTCCAQLGRWEEALSYLKKYKGSEPILAARAIALQGDCKAALGESEAAAALFEKAAAKADNMFAAAYLVKAGQIYLSLGQNDKALKAFETVKEKYPQSIEAYDIDKYINRVAE